MNRFLSTSLTLVTLFSMGIQGLNAADDSKAEMKIKGAGFFKDRLLVQQLKAIFHEEEPFFGPVDIEDAALIIISDLQSDGFLEAKTVGTITHSDGDVSSVEWEKSKSSKQSMYRREQVYLTHFAYPTNTICFPTKSKARFSNLRCLGFIF